MNWAYVAGFFDGEGCLGISAGLNLSATIGQSGQNGKLLLEEIRDFLSEQGIKSTVNPQRMSALSKKEKWILLISSKDKEAFFAPMLPYLHVKKAGAQDYLRYRELFPRLSPSTKGRIGNEIRWSAL